MVKKKTKTLNMVRLTKTASFETFLTQQQLVLPPLDVITA